MPAVYEREGTEFRVNWTTADSQLASSIAGLRDGGFVVTWMSRNQDGSGFGIYAQRYRADGIGVGAEFRVNTATVGNQNDPVVAALADGGFVVAWKAWDQDGSGWGIYAQRYGADGKAVGFEFRVNTTTTEFQEQAAIAALGDGGFVVTWQSSSNQDGSEYGIYAQRYAADGTAVGAEFQVNTTTAGSQIHSTVAALADGGFVVSWQSANQDGSGMGIYARRYDAAGKRRWGRVPGQHDQRQ